jgi:chromosomal replication initiation ATPase DnaA
MSVEEAPKLVTISESRLRELEAIEAEMSKRKTVEEYDAERFKMLREKDKANPENVKKRVLKYYETHKDEINARRREQRRLAREAETPGVGITGR